MQELTDWMEALGREASALLMSVEFYAQIVKEKSTLRRLIQISNETMARSYQDEESAEDILQHIEKAVFDIANQQVELGNGDTKLVIGFCSHSLSLRLNRI